jgi:hypothetical protein
MALGPFDSFAFPGVYTKTLNEAPLATASGELRIPAFIGVGDENTPVNNYEMIRGSSSMADNPIVRENVSAQFDGTNRNFTVSFFPVVNGDGTGTVTNDPSKIIVYINGEPVPVASINGATGVVYLINIPALGDEVLATYYYKKTDTLHTNEDLSDQVDGLRRTFRTHYYPVVKGDNGGITTTDPSRISVKINNNPATIATLDGADGLFTLASDSTALAGQTLTVTYYDNELPDTADILPSPYVSSIIKVGYAPGTSDFSEGVDFVLDTTGAFSTIQWGASYKISAGQHSNPSSAYFDDDQITGTLYDNHNYRRKATGTVDSTNMTFVLEESATDGGGRGVLTENPTLLTAYHGISPTDATVVDILQVIGSNTVLLQTPPPLGSHVYVTEYVNKLADDNWTLDCTVAGGTGVGKYTISGANSGVAMDVKWSASDSSVADPDFTSENVTYPAGTGPANSDAQVIPGYAKAETVQLTFADATTYTVGSNITNGSGSGGDNTGYLNQTYIDKVTGFRVTVMKGANVDYQALDHLGYTVGPVFTAVSSSVTEPVAKRGIPGIKVKVTDTINVGVGDTAILTTYNKSGAEPAIGDFYYVSFYETKQFDSNGLTKAFLYTQERDVVASTGTLNINNKLGLAAHLAFLNGAAALALLQIQKTVGGDDAPDSRYIAGIDYFNEPMPGGVRPNLMEPLSTSTSVLAYLKTSNVIQSGIRYANERYSWFGFALNTSPTSAQTFARSMVSERMMGIYPDGAVTTLQDAQGNDVEYLVDGAMMAAAVAGRDVSPAFDVAEPMTKKPIVGFKRLYRRMDSVTAAQTSNSGLTLLEEQAAGIDIRFALTTDTSSVLTRTPSIIRTKDFIQRGTRVILSPFIGQKLLSQRTSEIEQTLNSYLSSLQQAQIITAFQGVSATQDANDPTIVNVEAFYSPVFPLLWIVVTFNLRSSV